MQTLFLPSTIDKWKDCEGGMGQLKPEVVDMCQIGEQAGGSQALFVFWEVCRGHRRGFLMCACFDGVLSGNTHASLDTQVLGNQFKIPDACCRC